jgi:cell division cycle protein 37
MSQDGAAGQKALNLFTSDVDATYQRMEQRVQQMAAEGRSGGGGEGTEQIQLVAEGDAQISFNVPEGPPPDEIRLEGEGTEDMDPVEVRKFLVRQWSIFEGFQPEVQAALREESLEAVNKVLGSMSVDDAERLVRGTLFPPPFRSTPILATRR